MDGEEQLTLILKGLVVAADDDFENAGVLELLAANLDHTVLQRFVGIAETLFDDLDVAGAAGNVIVRPVRVNDGEAMFVAGFGVGKIGPMLRLC